jgi:hypothetical protein
MSVHNLISSLPNRLDEEIMENLVVGRGIRVERIVLLLGEKQTFAQATEST